MNPTANEQTRPSMRLLPHQAALVEAFFDPASKRVIVLRGEVGLGKSAALVAIASRLVQERPTARVLLLAPGALRVQFVEMLRDAGAPALAMDRYQFREWMDSSPGRELWPAGKVAVLSREFARQADIRDALAAVRWDLLIVDEAHQFRGTLAADVLRQVGEASDRVVLAIVPNLDLPEAFPEDDATVVQWRRDQVVDHDRKALDAMPRPILHVAHFNLSPAELSLSEAVGEMCRIFEAGTPQQRWIARSLQRALESSPAALEGALSRIREYRNRAAHGLEPYPGSSEEELPEDQLAGDLGMAETVTELANRALSRIETAGSDSKLAAFVALLGHVEAARTESTRICVLTEYVGTLFYLAAEMETLGKACQVFHAGMSAESRQNTLAVFSRDGGVLTATRAALSEGVALAEVTDLVLYDVPGSSDALQQVLGRFDRFGRRTQLNVYALLPTNGDAGPLPEVVGLLRQALRTAEAEERQEIGGHSTPYGPC